MRKKVKQIVIIGILFALIFWIGFRSGEMCKRKIDKRDLEKMHNMLMPPVPPSPKVYYIVETRDLGTYKNVNFWNVCDNDPIIVFLFNKNLKHLLKLRDIQIYAEDGERLY